MEIEVEELNALRSPFGYILATMNVDLDDSPSSGGCPRLLPFLPRARRRAFRTAGRPFAT